MPCWYPVPSTYRLSFRFFLIASFSLVYSSIQNLCCHLHEIVSGLLWLASLPFLFPAPLLILYSWNIFINTDRSVFLNRTKKMLSGSKVIEVQILCSDVFICRIWNKITILALKSVPIAYMFRTIFTTIEKSLWHRGIKLESNNAIFFHKIRKSHHLLKTQYHLLVNDYKRVVVFMDSF